MRVNGSRIWFRYLLLLAAVILIVLTGTIINYADENCDSSALPTEVEECVDPDSFVEPTDVPVEPDPVKAAIPVCSILAVKNGFDVSQDVCAEWFEYQLMQVVAGHEEESPIDSITFASSDMVFDHASEKWSYLSGMEYFSELTFHEAGIYEYRIREVKGTHTGFTYDESFYTVNIEVTEADSEGEPNSDPAGASNKLKAKLSYSKTKKGDSESTFENTVRFTNVYSPAAVAVTIKAQVVLGVKKGFFVDETHGNETAFKLDLTPISAGTSMEASISTSELELKTTTTSASYYSGTVRFSPQRIECPGEYRYQITEHNSGQAGFVYDAAVFFVTLKVTDGGGKLSVKYAYEKQTSASEEAQSVNYPEIVNRYAPASISADISIKNRVEGIKNSAKTFVFWLTRTSVSGMGEYELDDIEDEADWGYNEYGLKILKMQGEGETAFHLTMGTPGNYTYYLTERVKEIDANRAYIFDRSEYKIVFTVTDDRGTLRKSVVITKNGKKVNSIEFVNQKAFGTFTFYKVKPKDTTSGVKGALYGLYKVRAAYGTDAYDRANRQLSKGIVDDTLLKRTAGKISVTGGKAQFTNLSAGEYYVIKEETAPEGYVCSGRSIILHTDVKGSEVAITVVSSGSGTLAKDTSTGLFKWKEEAVCTSSGNHKWTYSCDPAPNLKYSGRKEKKCSICGRSVSKALPALTQILTVKAVNSSRLVSRDISVRAQSDPYYSGIEVIRIYMPEAGELRLYITDRDNVGSIKFHLASTFSDSGTLMAARNTLKLKKGTYYLRITRKQNANGSYPAAGFKLWTSYVKSS